MQKLCQWHVKKRERKNINSTSVLHVKWLRTIQILQRIQYFETDMKFVEVGKQIEACELFWSGRNNFIWNKMESCEVNGGSW